MNEKIQKLEESTAKEASTGKPISDLTPITELKDPSTFAIVQDSVTSKVSVETVNAYIATNTAKGFQNTRKKVLEVTQTGTSLFTYRFYRHIKHILNSILHSHQLEALL